MFIGEKIEERRPFTLEEKKVMLRKSKSKCCCCGKILTTKTMTAEHVIPLSRGGTNDMSNLIALCFDCNQYKSNLLYNPTGYCEYLNPKYYNEVCNLFYSWFNVNKASFDLGKYPLVTPRTRLVIYREFNKTSIEVGKFDLHYVGKDLRAEVEAVSGYTVPYDRPHYLLKNPKTDKLIGLVSIDDKGLETDLICQWSVLDSKTETSVLLCAGLHILALRKHTKQTFNILTVVTSNKLNVDFQRSYDNDYAIYCASRDYVYIGDTLRGMAFYLSYTKCGWL